MMLQRVAASRVAMMPSFSSASAYHRAFSYLRNTASTPIILTRPRNQSSQRLLSLTTTNATNQLSRNTTNGLSRISDTVINVKPITTFVSRSAHAQPKFKYQEKREWANLDTPEDLEKRINRIRVSKRVVCLLIVSQKPFNDHCLILAQHYLYPHHRLIVPIIQQKLATEAQLCIQDCTESIATVHFKEELQSATKAVENADLAYSELLEELASHDRVHLLNEVRRIYAAEGESVREELRAAIDQLKKNE